MPAMISYLITVVMIAISLPMYQLFANKIKGQTFVKEEKNGPCVILLEMFDSLLVILKGF